VHGASNFLNTMNNKDFWSIENKQKTDWDNQPKTIKECEACFNKFEADPFYAKRCLACKASNAPKRKKIINDMQPLNQKPF
jgi:hypothetical protein